MCSTPTLTSGFKRDLILDALVPFGSNEIVDPSSWVQFPFEPFDLIVSNISEQVRYVHMCSS